MRKNLRDRKTTLWYKASRRVRWKYTDDLWFAFVLDPETIEWRQQGIAHRQIGRDGAGRLVWPDQSIHQFKRVDVVLLTYRITGEYSVAEIVKNVLHQLNDLSGTKWYPPVGTEQGPFSPYAMKISQSTFEYQKDVQ